MVEAISDGLFAIITLDSSVVWWVVLLPHHPTVLGILHTSTKERSIRQYKQFKGAPSLLPYHSSCHRSGVKILF